jgi:serine/threonine-protein phosphatase 2A regulatory subunit B''
MSSTLIHFPFRSFCGFLFGNGFRSVNSVQNMGEFTAQLSSDEEHALTQAVNRCCAHHQTPTPYLRFFQPQALPQESDIQSLYSEAILEAHVSRMGQGAISNIQLEMLWSALQQFSDGSASHGETDQSSKHTISYSAFSACRQAVLEDHANSNLKCFFSSSTFLNMAQSTDGLVFIDDLFDCVMKKASLQQIRLVLCNHDPQNTGSITEKGLEAFILEQITMSSHLQCLDDAFHSIYAVYAVRKFFFVLDKRKTGRVRIIDLICSNVFNEFMLVQSWPADAPASDAIKRNWFSVSHVTKVHTQYIQLDKDQNGLLSRQEFGRIAGGYFTTATITRIFEECVTYDGEIDYKVYLDFVLAQEYPKSAAGLAFYFRILDIRQQGYLDAFTLNFFWRSIQVSTDMSLVSSLPDFTPTRLTGSPEVLRLWRYSLLEYVC